VKSGKVFNTACIAILMAAALVLVACVVAPTPPPQDTPASPLAITPTPTPTLGDTPTVDVNGTATPSLGDTPTPPLGNTPTPQVVQLPGGRSYNQYAQPPLMTIDPQQRYTASVRTGQGAITIELFASETPVTVNNFVFLAQEGFYNGVIFHRVIENFMIQTGDPRGDGSGGPGYRFEDEPVNRSYSRGKVAMANAGPNTNGSQFFIVHGANVGLPPDYTIFGEVSQGMEVVDVIASAEVQANPFGEMSSPVSPVAIETIQISTGPQASTP
jgi:cyclophilin family peptidyl-prolyl cis-trans isomerase